MKMQMYTWSDKPKFLAVAQAPSIEEARAALLREDELGESGDGSCPERDAARRLILENHPTIWHGVNAEFALTDSAELIEQSEWARKQIADRDSELSRLRERIAALERENAELKGRVISVTFGELFDAAPEVASEIAPHEWDNKNTVEQQEYLLTLIRRRELENADLRKRVEDAKAEELIARELLWIAHSQGMGYGDDGEMQYAMIDYKRQPFAEIRATIVRRNLQEMSTPEGKAKIKAIFDAARQERKEQGR